MSQTYIIKTISDLLKVPAERRLDCLLEIADGLEHIERICAQHRALLPRWLHWLEKPRIRQFEWIDDGRKDKRITAYGKVLFEQTDP